MSRRRILHVTTFYPPCNFGGDGVFVHRLANALARRGHDVHVIHDAAAFALLAPGDADGGRAPDDHPGVTRHRIRRRVPALPDLLAAHQLGRPVATAGWLRRRIAEIGPDVTHFHNVSLLGGPGVLALGAGVSLCTLHDYWFVCPMHTLWRLRREACTRRTCLRCTLHGRRPPQPWRRGSAVARAAGHVDRFLAPSRFAAAKHRELGFPAPVEHLPHFAPEPARAPSASRPSRRPFFLYAGRLETLKGVHELLPAFARLPGADLVIAGSGSLEGELLAAAARLANVELVGWVSGRRLEELFAEATAVVVPSLCFETFGLTVVEAFAAGAPVVVRRIGALTELVEDSGAGLTYATEDELVRALESLLDGEARQALAENARRAYRREYREDVHLQRYARLIDEAELASRGGGGP